MDSCKKFHEMGLDDRLLKDIAKLKWQSSTAIQDKVIPLVLEGKDVLAKARTGSGKTGAFLIPAIQKLLINKNSPEITQEVRVLILAPSKELCKQIYNTAKSLTSSCSRSIRCIDISGNININAQKPLIMEKPDIIVSTPGRIIAHLNSKNLSLENLEMLVIDEADLVFSFGYKDDITALLEFVPKIFQTIMTSATLSDDVSFLKKHVLHNPVVLQLDEPDLPEMSQLSQYYLNAEEEDKFVILCAFFKFSIIRGKTLLFVNSVDRGFKVSLFLEQFGINNCILNSELPIDSRQRIISEINEGLYNIIIASDEKHLEEGAKKSKKKIKKDGEFGVSRGIDFQHISNVINFDFPLNVKSYIHRVGRTARGTNLGYAISLVSIKEQTVFKEVEDYFNKDKNTNNEKTSIFKKFNVKMEDLEAVRYRTRDVYRSITRVAITEARQKEINLALRNSAKLSSYFEDNPMDLKFLRHDKPLHIVKSQPHLKNVPDYIVPNALKNIVRKESKFKKSADNSSSLNPASKPIRKGGRKYNKRKNDPLKNIKRK